MTKIIKGASMMNTMTDPAAEKLPTVEQVEEIMKDWGEYAVEEFSSLHYAGGTL